MPKFRFGDASSWIIHQFDSKDPSFLRLSPTSIISTENLVYSSYSTVLDLDFVYLLLCDRDADIMWFTFIWQLYCSFLPYSRNTTMSPLSWHLAGKPGSCPVLASFDWSGVWVRIFGMNKFRIWKIIARSPAAVDSLNLWGVSCNPPAGVWRQRHFYCFLWCDFNYIHNRSIKASHAVRLRRHLLKKQYFIEVQRNLSKNRMEIQSNF